MKKRIVEIEWLEDCPKCGAYSLAAKTERTDGRLNDCDDVVCFCGQTGYIDVCDGNAFVCWGDE